MALSLQEFGDDGSLDDGNAGLAFSRREKVARSAG
jgi:hypothetical protein